MLGSLLRNIIYDAVFKLLMPADTETIGSVDDVVVVIVADYQKGVTQMAN